MQDTDKVATARAVTNMNDTDSLSNTIRTNRSTDPCHSGLVGLVKMARR
jgi:hypothetical protein